MVLNVTSIEADAVFPSPWRGGVTDVSRSAIPPSLYLPYERGEE